MGATNLAFQKNVTASKTEYDYALARITDGEKEDVGENIVAVTKGKQWVQIDLENTCELFAVVIWHQQGGRPVFRCVAVQTAEDPAFTANVHTLFNNDYANVLGLGVGSDLQYYESHEGKLIDVKAVRGRYVRCYSNGNNRDPLNYYTEVEVWGLHAVNNSVRVAPDRAENQSGAANGSGPAGPGTDSKSRSS